MTDPLLSVVVPYYDVKRYLLPCLESIAAQTLTDFECIVVDDGSPDDAHLLVEELAREDRRFTLVRQDNAGLGPARNTGAGRAKGRYLTFVDSDDIVPPRAFSLMTGVLEQTGSSFAAGNARRFGGPDGVTQSWTHSIPFARTLLATHITAHPQLIRDRMAWNKVYRRDFWEASGLSFPATRYEDYPVSMRAHFLAESVDVVSDHIYYWRERESGDSITQKLFLLDNVTDRVRSAEWTLDTVEELGSVEALRLLTQYFIDVDLVAIARGLVHGAADEHDDILRLGTHLARRLTPLQRPGDPLADVIHRAFIDGDEALLRAMARWRDGDGVSGLRSELPAIPRTRHVRPLVRRVMPRRNRQNLRGPRRLRSSLVSMTTVEAHTTLVIDVTLRAQLAHRASVSVTLVGDTMDLPLQHSSEATPNGLRLTVHSDAIALERVGAQWEDCELTISLRVGALSWQGTVDASPALLTGPSRSRHSAYQWAAPRGHGLGLHRRDPVHIVVADVRDDVLTLTHPHMNHPRLSVLRPYPTPDAPFDTDGRSSSIDVRAVLDDPPDEPITGVAERRIVVDRIIGPLPLLLQGDPVVLVRDGRRAELARDSRGELVLRLSPAALERARSAEAAAAVEDHDAEGGTPPPELGFVEP